MKLLSALHRFWRASFREEKATFLVGLPLLFLFAGFEYSKLQSSASVPVFRESKDVSDAQILRVHVAGAVKESALHNLPQGSRVVDAIRLAKATRDADTNALNLAAPLRDGQKVVVPFRGLKSSPTAHRVLDTAPETASGSSPLTPTSKSKSPTQIVNINTASTSQLETLPGVGPAIAARIIARRNQKPFASLQDVDNVNGIGPKKLQQIAPYISF